MRNEYIICVNCEYEGDDFGEKEVYEYADADGNRGEWVTNFICPLCGEIF